MSLLAVDPTPAPEVSTLSGVVVNPARVGPRCFEDARSSLCKRIYDWTDNEWFAENSNWLIARPAKILVIIGIAVVVRWLTHRAIRRICDRAISGTGSLALGRGGAGANARVSLRRRAATLGSVLESLSTTVIFTIALLTVMAELTFNIAPLIASAGIVGVAIGFGAQALVKDFLSGIFMILEDQFGVGDEVDLGVLDLEGTQGTVESVGLRITSVRGQDGKLWHVRNGEIIRVGNSNQPPARPSPPIPEGEASR